MRCPKVNRLRTAARRRLMLAAAWPCCLQVLLPFLQIRQGQPLPADGGPAQRQAGGHIAGVGPLRMD